MPPPNSYTHPRAFGIAAPKCKKPPGGGFLLCIGSPTRARTWDLRINSPSLYQLSYQGIAAPGTGTVENLEKHRKRIGVLREPRILMVGIVMVKP